MNEPSDDHASAFFALCDDLLFVLDRDRTITDANPAALEELGLTLSELRGRAFCEQTHPDDRDRVEHVLRSVERRSSFEGRLERRGGEYRSLRFKAFHEARTDRLYLAGTATTSEPAERQLHDSQQRAEALFDGAAQGIIAIGPDGRIQSANPMARRIFGYDATELIGESVESLLPESVRQAHVHHRAQYFDKPRRRPMGVGLELMGRRKDGTEFPVEISLSHVRTRGEMTAVAFISDVTERRRSQLEKEKLEHRLEHATKMEAVGRLAGGIAHDFNNLLTALSGFSEIVLDELPEDHPLYEGAEETYKTCQRSASLVRRLLAVSRRQMLQPRVIELNSKLVDLEKMLRGVLGEDIELQVKLSADELFVRADESQLEQVILNLIVNARDAMPTGGVLSVRTSAVDIDDAFVEHNVGIKRGPHALLSVSDTGEGMAPEVLTRIFEPFFTTKEKGKGTGLGLATVYGIVQQSQGNIWAYSEPGQGATFKVYLPQVEASRTIGAPEAKLSTTAPSGETILVVEDENTVRLVTVSHLRQMGYNVLAARDGDEALGIALAHDGPIHVLLSDVVMPKMNGPELRERLRGKFPELPVVYMSGHADDALAQHGILEQGLIFLEKPFTREQVARKVQEALGRAPTP